MSLLVAESFDIVNFLACWDVSRWERNGKPLVWWLRDRMITINFSSRLMMLVWGKYAALFVEEGGWRGWYYCIISVSTMNKKLQLSTLSSQRQTEFKQ